MSDALYLEAVEALGAALERARVTGMRNADAMSLATVGRGGRPSVRMVLLRGLDARGLVFYTDAGSRKGTELKAGARAATCFYWEPIEEQARVEGAVEPVLAEEADADFARRPRAGQILIRASRQSRPLEDLEGLRARVAATEAMCAGGNVPRPDWWVGYRLVPTHVELWRGRRDRLHERIVYQRERQGGWRKSQLAP